MSQLFKYLKKGYAQEIVLGFLRFVSILLTFEKGYKQKIVLGIFEICKYPFFKYLKKSISKKIVLGFLRFCKYASSNI